MKNTIGIRREDLSKEGEKRVAVTPTLAKSITEAGHRLIVQSGTHPEAGTIKRQFPDDAYAAAGAELSEDLTDCDVIFGLKEIEIAHILAEKAYLFFSHTHKGQVKNRKMLQTLVDRKVTAFDYELIVEKGKGRVITAFTYFAGYAGQIDTLWAYGKRMAKLGHDHPFGRIPQSIELEDLGAIKEIIRQVGEEIKISGTPADLPPMINCILGTGKTSFGSQVIYDILPVETITPDQLKDTYENGDRKKVYKLVLEIDQMFRLHETAPVDCEAYVASSQQEKMNLYFEHPEYFESNIDSMLPYISILMNCILWGPKYPRLLPYDLMESTWEKAHMPVAIGDITCDPEGSIQFSKETWINNPVYLYDPAARTQTDGFDGPGVAVMAVTNLPCEFSADASTDFSANIEHLMDNLLNAHFKGSFADSGLRAELADAVILWQGKFTESYAYMQGYLD